MKNKLIIATIVAILIATPILFENPLSSSGIALVYILNMPGLFFATPHVPPEGIPGHSLSHALIMIFIQITFWYILISISLYFKKLIKKK